MYSVVIHVLVVLTHDANTCIKYDCVLDKGTFVLTFLISCMYYYLGVV
jgi:hypothetical protein